LYWSKIRLRYGLSSTIAPLTILHPLNQGQHKATELAKWHDGLCITA
jgi:hypothetical protein